MSDKHNVFISWSGSRSKHAATALRDWLPLVLPAAEPWMSAEDIDKGSRGLDEVGRALEGMCIGIICLTPENLSAPWVLFESGALSKTLDANTRVCTFLLGGLRPQDIERPLGMFQATSSSREDTKQLVHTINKTLEGQPRPKEDVEVVFERMWPLLEEKLVTMPKNHSSAPARRQVDEMVAEILELTRSAGAHQSRTFDLLDKRLVDIGLEIERRIRPMGSLRDFADLVQDRSAAPSVKSNDAADGPRHRGLIGEKLRELRDTVGVTAREVEAFSRAIAEDKQNEEFYISNAWLSQMENKNSVPSIFKLYSLSIIYRIKFADLLMLFGVDLISAGKGNSEPTDLHVS